MATIPTNQEQLLLELLNRARLDPEAEAKRYGISSQLVGDADLDPLAFNVALTDAARSHGKWEIATDTLSHTGVNGSTPAERMEDAGYPLTGVWQTGEALSFYGFHSSGGDVLDLTDAAIKHHEDLFRNAAHRDDMLSSAFSDVGIGQATGIFTSGGIDYQASLLTETFAHSDASGIYLMGVVYTDRSQDGFYSVGEGAGNMAVTLDGRTYRTWGTGGYQIQLARDTDNQILTFGTGASAVTIRGYFAAATGNIKIDVINGKEVQSSTSFALVSGASKGVLLGGADAHLSGTSKAETLVGNRGDNWLYGDSFFSGGSGGKDTLSGAAGDDSLFTRTPGSILNGGRGDDLAVLNRTGLASAFSLSLGSNGSATASDSTRLTSIERLAFTGGSGKDSVTGGKGADALSGAGGNDVLKGGAGADSLSGGDGNDTLSGEGGNDTIYGGAGSNRIDGGAGNDRLIAAGGADSVFGGDGNDEITFSAATALVNGGSGVDLVTASFADRKSALSFTVSQNMKIGSTQLIGVEDFYIIAGQGKDRITGGAYGENFYGQDGDDTLSGRGGGDYLAGHDGRDRLSGDDGNDTLSGGNGDDTLSGGAGNDALNGGSGRNRLDGGDGNDSLFGGDDAETLTGGNGHDLLVGGGGLDRLDGGAGIDIGHLDLGSLTGNLKITAGKSVTFSGGAALLNIEQIQILSGSGRDTLTGGAYNDTIAGGAGADSIAGGEGSDSLRGDAGNDTITGGGGHDTLEGGAGDDSLGGGAGYDILSGGDGNDTLLSGSGGSQMTGGAGADRFVGDTGSMDSVSFDGAGGKGAIASLATGKGTGGEAKGDTYSAINGFSGSQYSDSLTGDDRINDLSGNSGNDTLSGAGGRDTLDGGTGNDSLSGGSGDDTIYGGAGADKVDAGDGHDSVVGGDSSSKDRNDTLSGGEGSDTLYGGAGQDILTGGAGSDRFGYSSTADRGDTITDFESGKDALVFDASEFGIPGSSFKFLNGSAATAPDATFYFNTGTHKLYYDIDGTGSLASVFIAELTGVGSLAKADILLV